jgi:hypothetical protein
VTYRGEIGIQESTASFAAQMFAAIRYFLSSVANSVPIFVKLLLAATTCARVASVNRSTHVATTEQYDMQSVYMA